MYRIISTNTGVELGAVDAPFYIKIGESGSFCPAPEKEAIGVALNSVAYNLFGHEEIEGVDTVIVSETDGMAFITEQQKALSQAMSNADEISVDQEYRLTLLELGLSDI